MAETKIHQGRNIKRFREMLGIKQEFLAFELGDNWSQKKVSLLEQKEAVEIGILQHIATILKIPFQAIENFNEEQAIGIISNTFDLLEQSKVVEKEVLQRIEALLSFSERVMEKDKGVSSINIISNTVYNQDNASGNSLFSYYLGVNQLEK
ncbi:helix-turn-helix domain-containing protein [Sphingobacterium sp. MYb382]|uniref:helix-turn-helix domain-containing protein n=1 Tax=Sphingobacterium sp. MYb382 TaxID=2745278 RepID=UPI0030A21783